MESKQCELVVELPLRDFSIVEEDLKELGWDVTLPDDYDFDDALVLDYSLDVKILEGADARLTQLLTLIKLVPSVTLKGSVEEVDNVSVFLNDFAWKLQTIAKILDERTQ